MKNRYAATSKVESCLEARHNDTELQAPDGNTIKKSSREKPQDNPPKASRVSDESQYSSSGTISEQEALSRAKQACRILKIGLFRVLQKQKAACIESA